MNAEQEFAEEQYLASRGLHRAQVVADLKACQKAWKTWRALASELGLGQSTILNAIGEDAPFRAGLIMKLYGLHGNRLLVRGPDSKPIETRDVPKNGARAAAVAEEEDDVDAGVARIAAIVGRKPERNEPASELPSTLQPSAEKAPAAETAEAAGPAAAGLETKTAAGDGAAVDHQEIPAGPDVAAAEDVTEEPYGDAVTAADDAEAPEAATRLSPPQTAPVPGGAVTLSDAEAGNGGTQGDAPRSDDSSAVTSAQAGAVGFVDPAAPWSRLEDRDLVAILRGKEAGLTAEIAALLAEADGLLAHQRALQAREAVLRSRRAALRVAIDHFETEEGSAAPGIRGQQEIADGDEGEAA